MTNEEAIAKLQQEVSDLKQIMCAMADNTERIWDYLANCVYGYEPTFPEGFQHESMRIKTAAIARLQPVVFCPDCGEPYRYRFNPEDCSDGVGCGCSWHSTLKGYSLSDFLNIAALPEDLAPFPAAFVPPSWFAEKPATEAVAGQSAT